MFKIYGIGILGILTKHPIYNVRQLYALETQMSFRTVLTNIPNAVGALF